MITDANVLSLTPLIKYLVIRLVGFVDEDLLQEGFIGVLKARKTFDETKGRTWSSWAAFNAQNEMIESMRRFNKSKSKNPLTFCSFEELEPILQDMFSFEDEVIRKVDHVSLSKTLYDVLSEQPVKRQKRMVMLLSGSTKQDAAKSTGATPTMTTHDLRHLSKNEKLANIYK